MTCEQIQRVVMHEYYPKGRKIAVTNYSGCGLHEADIFMIATSGLSYEYEVKRSLADFKADFKKVDKHKLFSDKAFREERFKNYDSGWFTCPNYFYYVCVEGLIPIELVPDYAGLVYVTENSCRVVKKGRRLHNYKATERLYMSILQCLSARGIYGCSYMNFLRLENNSTPSESI